MGRTKGTYTLTSNIEPKVGAPLDARTIVKLLADLTASNTFEYPYKGMKVFVEENNKSYTLVGSDPTVSTNWIEDNSGGHTIKNQAGTTMTQRSNLQFVDLTVSDDSTNDATKVESVHVIQSESELENLPDGLYMLDEDEDTVIDGNLVGYDNTDSGLDADNVQDAIDEVVVALDDKIDISAKGVANGIAELDSTGKVPSSQLPSFVDDVIEVADYDHLPATGETGKIYVTLDTNKTYRWGGTEYVEISESLALGETSSTAYRGDRGKIAYDHSQLTSGNPHNVTKSDIGLGNVDNTSDSTKKTNFTGSIASGDTGFTTGGDVYTALGGKADKVSGATDGHIAGLDANGNLTDSGLAATTIVHKADKVSGQVAGHLASLSGTGNLADSGWNGAKDTTSISGNPISISGLKANQLAVNPIITFEPIQAGSGTPSPSNIRAISGYDKVEALSCEKNIWNEQVKKGYYNVSNVGEYVANNGELCSFDYIRVNPNTSYYFKKGSGTKGYIAFYDINKTYLNSYATPNATFTTPIDCFYITITLGNNYGTTYNNDVSINYPSTDTSYHAFNKTTDISESIGQTVYGGTLDVRTGLFTVTCKAVDMGTLTYNIISSLAAQGVFPIEISDRKMGGFLLSSGYDAKLHRSNWDINNYEIISIDNYKVFRICNSNYTTNEQMQNANSGMTLVYEIETPFTIQLTPHEISLLKDYAYVSTNGTNIALDYHNGELASLADVSQLGETLNELGNNVSILDSKSKQFILTNSYQISFKTRNAVFSIEVLSSNPSVQTPSWNIDFSKSGKIEIYYDEGNGWQHVTNN